MEKGLNQNKELQIFHRYEKLFGGRGVWNNVKIKL